MKRVELIYDADCPNIEATRRALLRAFADSKRVPRWSEWLRGGADSPVYTNDFGSPTILVDGKDICGATPSEASSCRLYPHPDGSLQGLPSIETIISALAATPPSSTLSRLAATLPGTGLLLLPVGACPACWPAYAGLLSSLGLGFLLDGHYLAPILVVLLVVALASLGYRAHQRRGMGPFALGLGGAAAALLGKFALAADALFYLGFAALLFAAVWNVWPNRRSASCAKCTPQESWTKTNPSANSGER